MSERSKGIKKKTLRPFHVVRFKTLGKNSVKTKRVYLDTLKRSKSSVSPLTESTKDPVSQTPDNLYICHEVLASASTSGQVPECTQTQEAPEAPCVTVEKSAPTTSPDHGLDENEEGEKEYVVESVMKRRKAKSGYQYLVKWEGYSQSTWEPECNLSSI